MTKEAQPYLLRIERAIVRINTYRAATEAASPMIDMATVLPR
jgi:hypothetical protein